MGPYVVIHLGKEQGIDESEAKIPHRFVLFDRFQIHRVLYEMHVGRNSLQNAKEMKAGPSELDGLVIRLVGDLAYFIVGFFRLTNLQCLSNT